MEKKNWMHCKWIILCIHVRPHREEFDWAYTPSTASVLEKKKRWLPDISLFLDVSFFRSKSFFYSFFWSALLFTSILCLYRAVPGDPSIRFLFTCWGILQINKQTNKRSFSVRACRCPFLPPRSTGQRTRVVRTVCVVAGDRWGQRGFKVQPTLSIGDRWLHRAEASAFLSVFGWAAASCGHFVGWLVWAFIFTVKTDFETAKSRLIHPQMICLVQIWAWAWAGEGDSAPPPFFLFHNL